LEFTPEKDASATSLAADTADDDAGTDGPNTPKRACRFLDMEKT